MPGRTLLLWATITIQFSLITQFLFGALIITILSIPERYLIFQWCSQTVWLISPCIFRYHLFALSSVRQYWNTWDKEPCSFDLALKMRETRETIRLVQYPPLLMCLICSGACDEQISAKLSPVHSNSHSISSLLTEGFVSKVPQFWISSFSDSLKFAHYHVFSNRQESSCHWEGRGISRKSQCQNPDATSFGPFPFVSLRIFIRNIPECTLMHLPFSTIIVLFCFTTIFFCVLCCSVASRALAYITRPPSLFADMSRVFSLVIVEFHCLTHRILRKNAVFGTKNHA